jgi:hypothetical protein
MHSLRLRLKEVEFWFLLVANSVVTVPILFAFLKLSTCNLFLDKLVAFMFLMICFDCATVNLKDKFSELL